MQPFGMGFSLSLDIISMGSTQVVACIKYLVFFNGEVVFHNMNQLQLFNHFFTEQYSDRFQFGVIMNKAVVNIPFCMNIRFHFSRIKTIEHNS